VSSYVIAGRYIVQRALGQGFQGEVYEVADSYEDDVVALKLLTNLPPIGPWGEARVLRRLTDRHILPIRNADLAAGVPYIVTELATHGSLEDLLQARPVGLDVDDVVRWMRQAAYGLGRAHALRLLHNDIKPGNLFLDAHGDCLLADFGFAGLMPTGASTIVPPGFSPSTVAPEIASGWGTGTATASIGSDIFSLGATAFWLLTGIPVYDYSGLNGIDAMMATASVQRPARVRDVAPHVPGYVATVVEKALAVAPTDRYLSAGDMAAALGRRPATTRRWERTDEHSAHLGCWRGKSTRGGGTYVLCLTQGATSKQVTVETVHHNSGRRVAGGSRVGAKRTWAQLVRSVMRDVG
jgi:serine/threonine-protein kinase